MANNQSQKHESGPPFDETDVDTWTVIGVDGHGRFLIRTGPEKARVYNLVINLLSAEHELNWWLDVDFKPYFGTQKHLKEIFKKYYGP